MTTTALANLPAQWEGTAGAWLAEVAHRTGSPRTPQEYGPYLARFLELVGDPAQATTAHVHAFAYGPGSSRAGAFPGNHHRPSGRHIRLLRLCPAHGTGSYQPRGGRFHEPVVA